MNIQITQDHDGWNLVTIIDGDGKTTTAYEQHAWVGRTVRSLERQRRLRRSANDLRTKHEME